MKILQKSGFAGLLKFSEQSKCF